MESSESRAGSDKYEFVIKRSAYDGMKADAVIYGSREIVNMAEKDGSIRQLVNVASLPSIVGRAIAMPDIHSGYGFPIGGVAAFDMDEGIISPGGVGYDINCGVTLISVPITVAEFLKKQRETVDDLFVSIPSGVGVNGKLNLSESQTEEIMVDGIDWAIRNGYGIDSDTESTEEEGRFDGADPSMVSRSAIARGRKQIGTLGAGNHFVEVQRVGEVVDGELAGKFGILDGELTVMVHTGSRGLGHQVASDYIEKLHHHPIKDLPDEQLVYARSSEKIYWNYLAAMKAAANFAFVNREIITSQIRKTFSRHFKLQDDDMRMIYSISHNLAREETHDVDGHTRKLMVHRKGATRALPPGRKENGLRYRETGHPVLVPGDMGRKSYVLVGTERNLKMTFASSCHGAGRQLSRHAALRSLDAANVKSSLQERKIYLKTASSKAILEEAPESYKDVDKVVKSVEGAEIARIVTSLYPMGVVKG